jgi:hypothetical protein
MDKDVTAVALYLRALVKVLVESETISGVKLTAELQQTLQFLERSGDHATHELLKTLIELTAA